MRYTKGQWSLFLLRISLSLIFLWAFFDKLFGLGISTAKAQAWLAGGSPTTGFLRFGATGPLHNFYASLAGQAWVDWLFMVGLLLIGLSLLLGVGMKIAIYTGSLLLLMMWSALLWPKNHPFLDDHLIYILVLFVLQHARAGRILGFGERWSNTALVKKFPILE